MKQTNKLIILAIETSCDDTGIAIVKVNKKKLSKIKTLVSLVSSQVKIHQKYGGVYPLLAKREHQKNLPILLEKAKKKAKNPKINIIAVTVGPGLDPCLWTGVNFTRELAKKLRVPVIPVNHIEAHIYANFITTNNDQRAMNKIFPSIALIVSGGHTQLILVKKIWQIPNLRRNQR